MLESQYLVYGLYALLFILVFLSFLALFSYLRKNSVISNSLKNFYEKAENSVKERWRVEKSQEIVDEPTAEEIALNTLLNWKNHMGAEIANLEFDLLPKEEQTRILDTAN